MHSYENGEEGAYPAGRVWHGSDNPSGRRHQGHELTDRHTGQNADQEFAIEDFFETRFSQYGLRQLRFAAMVKINSGSSNTFGVMRTTI